MSRIASASGCFAEIAITPDGYFLARARWRYEQVARIVRQKYGARVTGLIPTPASSLYLWGDDGTAPFRVQKVRKKVFGIEVGTDWIL